MALLLATGYESRAIPSPRTTNYAPRTRRADTWVRPYDEMTHHKPQATCRCFVIPAKRAFGSRELVQTGAVSNDTVFKLKRVGIREVAA